MKYYKVSGYNKFVNENLKDAKNLISKKLQHFEDLKELMKDNLGWIGQFTEWLFSGIKYEDLVSTYNDLLELKKSNYSIDIRNLTFEQCTDKIINNKENLIINRFINQFPSEQKNLIKPAIEDYKNVIIKCAKKDNKAFISKISRYKEKKDLINALKIFSKDSDNNKENVIKYAKETETCNLVYDNDKFTIIELKDIKDVQKLGSDTSWCILRQGNWDSYTKGRHQFIMYQWELPEFDNDFKIGFTLNKSGIIYAAHNILDNDVVSKLFIIFRENEINTLSLIPAPIKIDLTKLKSTSSYEVFEDAIQTADKANMLTIWGLLWKKMRTKDNPTKEQLKCIIMLLNQLFNEYEVITDDIIKTVMKNEEWSNFVIKNHSSLPKDNHNIKYPNLQFSYITEKALAEAIRVRSDAKIIGSIDGVEIYDTRTNTLKESITPEILKLYIDRITKLDVDQIMKKSGYNEAYKKSQAIKMKCLIYLICDSNGFKITLEQLGITLEDIDSTLDDRIMYSNIWPNYIRENTLSIRNIYDIPDNINLVKKEDSIIYLEPKSSSNTGKYLPKLEAIIDYLKDYKIEFKLTKRNAFLWSTTSRTSQNEVVKKLEPIFMYLSNSRTGTTRILDNITIKTY